MKLPWLKRYRVPEEDKAQSEQALKESQRILGIADRIKADAVQVGEGQRKLRAENHFGQKLTHIYQNRSAT